MTEALRALAVDVSVAGTSDLAFRSKETPDQLLKISGNSMRKSRDRVLYHGTLFYNFDLDLVESALLAPPRTPDYRSGRAHLEFVTNLPVRRPKLFDAITTAWDASELVESWPRAATDRLEAEKYATHDWNARR